MELDQNPKPRERTMRTKSLNCYLIVLSLISILSVGTTVFGQSTLDSSKSTKKHFGKFTVEHFMERRDEIPTVLDMLEVDIEINGVTVDTFLEVLQGLSPIHLNIVALEDAKDVVLPSMKLSGVSAMAAINALSVATDELIQFDVDPSGQIGFISRKKEFRPNSRVTVVNLSHVLNAHSNESFLSAVEIGMEMMGRENSSIQMKLHEPTKTLFLKGTSDEIRLVEEVVTQMSMGLRRPPNGMGGGMMGSGGRGGGDDNASVLGGPGGRDGLGGGMGFGEGGSSGGGTAPGGGGTAPGGGGTAPGRKRRK